MRAIAALALMLLVAAPASAQPASRPRDTVWEGVLIGGAIAAVGGFIVAPYLLCGHGFDDTECTVIVRAAVGLPMLAGGLILGGLIDKFHDRGPIVWRDRSGKRVIRVGPFGPGVRVSVSW